MIDTLILYVTTNANRFYGVDWAAAVCLFLGMYLITRKNRTGFLIAAMGGVCWIAYAVMAGSIAQMLSNTIFVTINLIGYFKWRTHNLA